MDSTLMSNQTSPTSTIGDRRGRKFRPLTQHGMPKEPSPGSPRSIRPHRFSSIMSPFSPPTSPPMTPMSPGMQSPPMSAKSFGTFIDSAPSTPAYSPRMGNGWDSSTLMLLSPASTAPSSPPEPEWEMMTPGNKAKAKARRSRQGPAFAKEIAPATSLASHPIKAIEEEGSKENTPPVEEQDGDAKPKEEEHTQPAPLKGFATRMKSILRRKSSETEKTKKREKRQKQYEEFDRMEDSHWTEY